MGTNDRIPNKNATTGKSRRSKSAELLDWGMADEHALWALIQSASQAGAYIAFGATVPPTCLLLYIRSGDWKERVAIEAREDITPTIEELTEEFSG